MFVQATAALVNPKIKPLEIRVSPQAADSQSNRAASIDANDYVASFPPRSGLEAVRGSNSAEIQPRQTKAIRGVQRRYLRLISSYSSTNDTIDS